MLWLEFQLPLCLFHQDIINSGWTSGWDGSQRQGCLKRWRTRWRRVSWSSTCVVRKHGSKCSVQKLAFTRGLLGGAIPRLEDISGLALSLPQRLLREGDALCLAVTLTQTMIDLGHGRSFVKKHNRGWQRCFELSTTKYLKWFSKFFLKSF